MEENRHSRPTELQQKINNHNVLQSELTQLKPNAKVYRKQENSNVYFLSKVETELHSCKETLNSLIQEYNKESENQSSVT